MHSGFAGLAREKQYRSKIEKSLRKLDISDNHKTRICSSKLAERLPKEEQATTEAPVETKGYKSIPGLPDWPGKNGIEVKSENPCANRRLLLQYFHGYC